MVVAKEKFNLEDALKEPRAAETVGGRVLVNRPSFQELRASLGPDAEVNRVATQLRIADRLSDKNRQAETLGRLEEVILGHILDAQDALDAATAGSPEEVPAAEQLADWMTLRNFIEELRVSLLTRQKEGEKPVIDYKDPWNSWARIQGWLKEGEDPHDHEVIERMEREFFHWLMNLIVNRFWDNPNNKDQAGYLEFLGQGWEIQGGESRLILDSIINGFPGNQNHLRDLVNLISHSIKGGISWQEIAVAKENGPHEKVLEHLEHYLFGGKEWEELAHLPALAEHEKTLGDLAFEGLDWYSHWNEKFVLPTRGEIIAIGQQVDASIVRNEPHYAIPSRKVISDAYDQAEKRPSDIYPFDLDSTTDADVIYLFGLAEKNYDQFRQDLRNHIVRQKTNKISVARQEKKGIFPLLDVGEIRFAVDAFGERKSQRDVYRTEIAIAVGCYNLGVGEYDFQIDDNGNITRGIYEDRAHTRRINYTAQEFDAILRNAFDKGRAGELVAFSAYESNLGSSHDDNATFLATTKPTRLLYTRSYRLRYPGQEGVWNKHQFGALVPKVFDYMAADSTSLKKLFHDRDTRVHADYEAMQEILKKFYIELYGFGVNMYDVLDLGLQRGVKGFHLDKLGSFITESRYSTEEKLSVDTTAIDNLTDFWRKVIGYWLSPRLLIDESQIASGLYDPEYWTVVEGTEAAPAGKQVRSPIFSKQMFYVSNEDRQRMTDQIRRMGGQKKAVTSVLQKAIFASMTFESFLLLGSEYLNPAEREAVIFAYSGQTEYKIKQGAVGDSAIPGYGFSRQEVVEMLRRAKVVRDGLGYALLSALSSSSRT